MVLTKRKLVKAERLKTPSEDEDTSFWNVTPCRLVVSDVQEGTRLACFFLRGLDRED